MACTYNVGGPDGTVRECGRPASTRWVRLSDMSVRVVTCKVHDRVVGRALGFGLPLPPEYVAIPDVGYRREAVEGGPHG